MTKLYHILRWERSEQVLEGQCLRLAHLVMVYNAVHGTRPFIFHGDDEPCAMPDQDSSIDQDSSLDPKIFQLVQTPRLPSPSALPVTAFERFRNDVLIIPFCNASRYVRFIMDPEHHP